MKVSLDEPGDCPGNKQPGIIKHQLLITHKKTPHEINQAGFMILS